MSIVQAVINLTLIVSAVYVIIQLKYHKPIRPVEDGLELLRGLKNQYTEMTDAIQKREQQEERTVVAQELAAKSLERLANRFDKDSIN